MLKRDVTLTIISSDFSSNGSDSTPSGERRSPLTNVPFEDLTSLMKICSAKMRNQHLASLIEGEHLSTHFSFLFPNLCVHTTQYFTIEIPIPFARNRLDIRLSSNLDPLTSGKMDHLHHKRLVERP